MVNEGSRIVNSLRNIHEYKLNFKSKNKLNEKKYFHKILYYWHDVKIFNYLCFHYDLVMIKALMQKKNCVEKYYSVLLWDEYKNNGKNKK